MKRTKHHIMTKQPTLEQFARLDEKTAAAIQNLGERMESWAKSFASHVEEDRQLRREFTENQRQLDRVTDSLNSISKQLADIALGFSRTVLENTNAMAVLRSDVETLKNERAFQVRESSRKDINIKKWIGVIGAMSGVVGAVVGHFWK